MPKTGEGETGGQFGAAPAPRRVPGRRAADRAPGAAAEAAPAAGARPGSASWGGSEGRGTDGRARGPGGSRLKRRTRLGGEEAATQAEEAAAAGDPLGASAPCPVPSPWSLALGGPAPRLCARRWCSPAAGAGAASARASPRRPPPRLRRDPPLGGSRAGEASAPPAP